jgi:TPR repeat protein
MGHILVALLRKVFSKHYKAQNNIGILYYLGDGDSSFKGFKADATKSLDWFKLAINNGSKSAETNSEIAQSYLYGRDDKRIAELVLE